VLEIRQVQADDIFTVISIANEMLPERYNPAIFTQFYEAFPQGFLIAELHRVIIGFLIGVRLDPHRARILMLAIQTPHQRQQTGSKLLLRFLNDMRAYGVTAVELEVRTNNRSAIEFYRAHGFTIQETLTHFYQNGDAAYQMRRDL
jgi:ribosomal-protein-alanine N-acetyltransferase